jgi:hypothetical protein
MIWIAPSEKDTGNVALEKHHCRLNLAVHGLEGDIRHGGQANMSLEAANREVYLLLKEGIKVSVPETDSTPHPGPLPGRGGEGVRSGGQKTERVRVIDWEQPANNDFLLVSQFSVTGALYTCRPDSVGFVNPDWSGLVVIELKGPGAGKCRMTNFDCRTAASSNDECRVSN